MKLPDSNRISIKKLLIDLILGGLIIFVGIYLVFLNPEGLSSFRSLSLIESTNITQGENSLNVTQDWENNQQVSFSVPNDSTSNLQIISNQNKLRYTAKNFNMDVYQLSTWRSPARVCTEILKFPSFIESYTESYNMEVFTGAKVLGKKWENTKEYNGKDTSNSKDPITTALFCIPGLNRTMWIMEFTSTTTLYNSNNFSTYFQIVDSFYFREKQ